MRKFLNKLTCMAVSLTFLMGCMATPAFAYGGEETGEEVKAPSIFETAEEPVTVTEQDIGPLTPEGNLTVVDDYQTTFSDGTAQQFITLVSKSGAYFYLIIDRAADGDQTAHFLNMVDEADLLVLMDEEDIPEPEPEPAPTPEPEPMPESEPEPEKEDGAGKFLLVLLVLAGIAGGGAYFWLKMQQKKREAEENKPDPDADYREDEEEIVLPEEEPESEPDEDAERKAYQGSDGYEEE